MTAEAAAPVLRPVGDGAVLVELGRVIDPGLNARVRTLDAALTARPFPGLRECVPAYASLLVVFDPRVTTPADVAASVHHVLGSGTAPALSARRHRIPVAYGGADGPDLEEVARQTGLTTAEVIHRHEAVEVTAYFLGFLPGFAYLGRLPEALAVPRLATPRARVPAGSVGIAGRQTAIYPADCPGGWNLIGRTSVRLFDPSADPPALLRPGDTVRFVASTEDRDRGVTTKGAPEPSSAAVEVLDGGFLTTVQDGGRFGHRRWGVPWCGALDATSRALVNAAVGSPPDAAVLECTASGPTLRFLAPVRFAVAGGDFQPVLERADLGAWPVPAARAVLARPGNVLSFRGRRAGFRTVIALRGGVDVPLVLGSRSTDLVSGFGGLGGRALVSGDRLAVGTGAVPEQTVEPSALADRVVVRVVPGPQEDAFTPEALERLQFTEYTLGPLSDRIGARLEGPPLAHRGPSEIVTDGLVPGCIQVPPDGRPIVMLADCPTTGGYPKIATVVAADLPLLAQLVPGEGRIRFVRA